MRTIRQQSQQILGQQDLSVYTNIPPVANAGLNQTVYENSVVMLDGRGSYDPNGDELIAYWWQPTSNDGQTPILLSGYNTATPTFVAPLVPYNDLVLEFTLHVTDRYGTTSQTPSIVYVHVKKAISDPNINNPLIR